MPSPPTDASKRLHLRAQSWVRAFELGVPMPESFDTLACDLARFQAAHNDRFARLCRARAVDPVQLSSASEIPAVPTEAFKVARIATFPESETSRTFRTSGTTIGQRGSHAFRDLATYDAAAVAFGRWALAAGLLANEGAGAGGVGASVPARVPVAVVGPSPRHAPDSSLTHMIHLFVQAFGTPATDAETYFVEDDILDLAGLDDAIARALVSHSPMLVLGTSFAFVHLLDGLGDNPFRLPAGSRVMQTGGFKGRSREVDARTLRRDLATAFSLDERAVVTEYGMTELSSQFYEATARDPSAKLGVLHEPPWARVVPVDPDTLEPVPHGEVGIARILDLMNVDSAVAVLVPDRVRRVEGGFELLGRAPGATPRGCSIGIDELLGA